MLQSSRNSRLKIFKLLSFVEKITLHFFPSFHIVLIKDDFFMAVKRDSKKPFFKDIFFKFILLLFLVTVPFYNNSLETNLPNVQQLTPI